MKIMIVGSGNYGCEIAQTLISKENEVILRDLNHDALETAILSIVKKLEQSVVNGYILEDEKNKMLKRISTTIDIKDASSCDLVIDATGQNTDDTKKLFKQLDHICKRDTILATSTSALALIEIAQSTTRTKNVVDVNTILGGYHEGV